MTSQDKLLEERNRRDFYVEQNRRYKTDKYHLIKLRRLQDKVWEELWNLREEMKWSGYENWEFYVRYGQDRKWGYHAHLA